jgi:hypothetical protein
MRKIIITLLAAAIAAATTVPLAASADRDEELVIGVRVDFVSSSHAEGTFAACCAVNDSGRAQADVTSFTVKPNNTAAFEAIETFTGSMGTFRLALRGTTGPLTIGVEENPNHVARGRWRVLDGTGAYADLEGRGRFTAVTNQTTGALTAINRGEGGDD